MTLFVGEVAAVAVAGDVVGHDFLEVFDYAVPVTDSVKIAYFVTGAESIAGASFGSPAAAGGLAGSVWAVGGVADAS